MNTTLITLDLSSCDVRKEGLEHIVEGICADSELQNLSLNDNHLDESCVDSLRDLIDHVLENVEEIGVGLELSVHSGDLEALGQRTRGEQDPG